MRRGGVGGVVGSVLRTAGGGSMSIASSGGGGFRGDVVAGGGGGGGGGGGAIGESLGGGGGCGGGKGWGAGGGGRFFGVSPLSVGFAGAIPDKLPRALRVRSPKAMSNSWSSISLRSRAIAPKSSSVHCIFSRLMNGSSPRKTVKRFFNFVV